MLQHGHTETSSTAVGRHTRLHFRNTGTEIKRSRRQPSCSRSGVITKAAMRQMAGYAERATWARVICSSPQRRTLVAMVLGWGWRRAAETATWQWRPSSAVSSLFYKQQASRVCFWHYILQSDEHSASCKNWTKGECASISTLYCAPKLASPPPSQTNRVKIATVELSQNSSFVPPSHYVNNFAGKVLLVFFPVYLMLAVVQTINFTKPNQM